MNLVLGQVEENIHHVDVTEDGQPMQPRVERRNMEMLFVRGDGVILVRRSIIWGKTQVTALSRPAGSARLR